MVQQELFATAEDRRFYDYHKNNPHVFAGFKALIRRVKRKKRKHYGAKALFEVLRFETITSGKDEFKINNNFVSRYVRLYERETGDTAFFEKRTLHNSIMDL